MPPTDPLEPAQSAAANVQRLIEQLQQHVAAAEAELSKAAQASAAALTAKQAAEAAKQSAEADRDQAALAREAATAAKAAAESEREQAVQAQIAANAAKSSAEAEQQQAVQAKNATNVAKASAESERDQAFQAKTEAVAAKSSAETERNQAIEAKAQGIAARTEAEAQRDLATNAKDAANTARTQAEAERELAIQAKAASEAARTDAQRASENASKANLAAKDSMDKAEAEAKRAAEAHHLSTTAGLAGAFNVKASEAAIRGRTWLWVLILALIAAAGIGWYRYEDLRELIATKPDTAVLVAEVLLSVLGLGAPVWLGWVATRMISKNFVIGEDYAYKASLAKAYVGFRDEARGLDPLLEQRLFAAAITQLDANPVRFVDSDHPGSPLQDLLQQPFMQEVLQTVPIKQHLIDWFNDRFKLKLLIPPPREAPTIKPLP